MMNRSIAILCSLDLTVLTSFSVVRVTFAGARQNLVTEFEMRAMISMKLKRDVGDRLGFHGGGGGDPIT